MVKKKRQRLKTKHIEVGSWFGVPLSNGRVVLGQVLHDKEFLGGYLPCALFDMEYDREIKEPDRTPTRNDIIATLSLGRVAFDRDEWPVGNVAEIVLPKNEWPNEEYRKQGIPGSKVYDAGLGEDFLEAFYGLLPWNGMYDPEYYAKILFRPHPRPQELIFKDRSEK